MKHDDRITFSLIQVVTSPAIDLKIVGAKIVEMPDLINGKAHAGFRFGLKSSVLKGWHKTRVDSVGKGAYGGTHTGASHQQQDPRTTLQSTFSLSHR